MNVLLNSPIRQLARDLTNADGVARIIVLHADGSECMMKAIPTFLKIGANDDLFIVIKPIRRIRV